MAYIILSFLVNLLDSCTSFNDLLTITHTLTFRLLLETFERVLYEKLYYEVIYCEDIELLSSLYSVVFTELLGQHAGSGVVAPPPKDLEAVWPLLKRILDEIASRLVDVSTLIIRDEILGYVPVGQDLNYPEILTNSGTSIPCLPSRFSFHADDGVSWFPTVERTLGLLSRLYLIIDVLSHVTVSRSHLVAQSL